MNPSREAPIGVFDSGVGGLTVWREIVRLLPGEHTRYLADSAHAPYGEKSGDQIRALSRRNTERLLSMGCKIIVVACNTATTNAISELRASYPVPFIGIEPAIKPAALQSSSGTIGVLATRGTLSSELFARTSGSYGAGIRILEAEGRGLVEAIESGMTDPAALRDQLTELLRPMVDAGIDHLVLGCTHYPLLSPMLEEVLPSGIRIVDCGMPVARQVRAVLQAAQLLRQEAQGSHQVFTNADPGVMNQLLTRMGFALRAQEF